MSPCNIETPYFHKAFSLLLATWVYTTFLVQEVSAFFLDLNDETTLQKLTRFATVAHFMDPNDETTMTQTTKRRTQTTKR